MALDIRMTPEEIRKAATDLNGKKDEILAAVGCVETIINTTVEGWSGASQSAFVEGFESMKPVLKEDFPSAIEGLASQLTAAADTMEAADTELANALKG